MAVMHLPVKFGADIFIQCGVIDILPKLKMAAAAILDLLGGESWDHPQRHTRVAYSLLKFRHDRISSFQVLVVQACKSYSRPQNLSFWGVLPAQNLRAHYSDPQKAHPCVISRLMSYRA